MIELSTEQLKEIVSGAEEEDLFYCQGRYLNKNLEERVDIRKYFVGGHSDSYTYSRQLSVDMSQLHLISDLAYIVEIEGGFNEKKSPR